MIEFIAVDHPTAFPQACMVCMGQKGPMVDVHRELPSGHVYICQVCAKSISRVLGFAEGKKLDELEQAATRAYEQERVSARLEGELREERRLRAVEHRSLEQSIEQVNFLNGRVKQLEKRLREEASAALELVGGEAA